MGLQEDVCKAQCLALGKRSAFEYKNISQRLLHAHPWGNQPWIRLPPSACAAVATPGTQDKLSQGSLLLNSHTLFLHQSSSFPLASTSHRGGPGSPRARRAHSAFETSHLISTSAEEPLSPVSTGRTPQDHPPPKEPFLASSAPRPSIVCPVYTRCLNHLFTISIAAW